MLIRINLTIILFLIFSFKNFAFAENKILFVDIDYIYINSVAGKEINNNIKKETNIIKTELESYKKEIDNDKKNLANQKNVLAKEEFEKRYIELDNLIKESNTKINKKNNELLKYQNNVKNEFKKKLDLILRKYAKENSVHMIINKKNILIGKNDLDATNDILKLFDKEIKKINLN